MKSIIISKPGDARVLQPVNRPVPVPSDHEVLIKIKAAGINRPDIAQRKGQYPAPPGAPPDIPGLEISGIIEACGKKVNRWKKGDSICALLAGGGYAEFVAVNEGQCLPLPKGLDFIQAASLPETVFTVWHNVFQRGALKKGENFLVHGGTSGIGTTAIQIAKGMGAKAYATARTEEKCNACLALGADDCINYEEEDFEEKFQKQGMDVILDMIGGDYVAKNIRLLRPDGRLVFINAMKGSEMDLNIRDIMKKRLTITGSTLRNREISFKSSLAREVEKNVWPLIEAEKFKPVIYQVFSLEDAAQAHELMESSTHIGKIVLVNG